MRIHLQTLGCRLNEAELETWSRDFQAQGHKLAAAPEDADLLVVNTCAVTEEAVRKSKKLLRRAHRNNPQARLVVSGCQASLDPTATAATDGVDLVVPNQEKEHLVALVKQKLDLHAIPEIALEQHYTGLLERGRQRAFIKVQDGCRYRCTFCIVTLARGEEHSRPIDEIIKEINQLVSEGIKEVVLTGVHLGGYGSDIGSDLSKLIQQVLSDTELPRLRIGSLEPWDLPEGFWKLFENSRFMPHLHLPLQSGSDTVLRRMARRCKTAEYQRIIDQARTVVRHFNVTTDIIVGFPGETEAEWRESMDFIEKIGFGHLHIFAYSPRDGTKAARLADPVSREIKQRRSQELHQLADKMKAEYLQRYHGTRLPVLIEGSGEAGWSGYTPNYLKVRIKDCTKTSLYNEIIDCRLSYEEEQPDRLSGSC